MSRSRRHRFSGVQPRRGRIVADQRRVRLGARRSRLGGTARQGAVGCTSTTPVRFPGKCAPRSTTCSGRTTGGRWSRRCRPHRRRARTLASTAPLLTRAAEAGHDFAREALRDGMDELAVTTGRHIDACCDGAEGRVGGRGVDEPGRGDRVHRAGSRCTARRPRWTLIRCRSTRSTVRCRWRPSNEQDRSRPAPDRAGSSGERRPRRHVGRRGHCGDGVGGVSCPLCRRRGEPRARGCRRGGCHRLRRHQCRAAGPGGRRDGRADRYPGSQRAAADLRPRPERALAVVASTFPVGPSAVASEEDDTSAAGDGVRRLGIGPGDVVIGLAASGKTPFVLAGLRAARAAGAWCCGIANNPDTPLLEGRAAQRPARHRPRDPDRVHPAQGRHRPEDRPQPHHHRRRRRRRPGHGQLHDRTDGNEHQAARSRRTDRRRRGRSRRRRSRDRAADQSLAGPPGPALARRPRPGKSRLRLIRRATGPTSRPGSRFCHAAWALSTAVPPAGRRAPPPPPSAAPGSRPRRAPRRRSGELSGEVVERRAAVGEDERSGLLVQHRLAGQCVLQVDGVVVDAVDATQRHDVDSRAGRVGSIASRTYCCSRSPAAYPLVYSVPGAGRRRSRADPRPGPVALRVGDHHMAPRQQSRPRRRPTPRPPARSARCRSAVGRAATGRHDDDIGPLGEHCCRVDRRAGAELGPGEPGLPLEVRRHAAELGTAGKPLGEFHLAAEPCCGLEEHDVVAGAPPPRPPPSGRPGRRRRRRRAGPARAHLQAERELATGLRVLDARDRVAAVEVADARLVAAHARPDVVERPGHGLVGKLRVGDQRACHRARIGLAAREDHLGVLRLVDAPGDQHRHVDHGPQSGRERRGVAVLLGHRRRDVVRTRTAGRAAGDDAEVVGSLRAVAARCTPAAPRRCRARRSCVRRPRSAPRRRRTDQRLRAPPGRRDAGTASGARDRHPRRRRAGS